MLLLFDPPPLQQESWSASPDYFPVRRVLRLHACRRLFASLVKNGTRHAFFGELSGGPDMYIGYLDAVALDGAEIQDKYVLAAPSKFRAG